MKKLWIAVNSTSFLLVRYEMTIFIEWCSMSSKTFLKGFLKKKSFFLWNVGHSIWYLLAQNIFKPPKPFLITLRKEILSEIPNRWNQNNSNFTFYRLKSQTNCSKKILHLSLHQNFNNILLHGVNVCTQYLPSNRRLSIMFTIPIS